MHMTCSRIHLHVCTCGAAGTGCQCIHTNAAACSIRQCVVRVTVSFHVKHKRQHWLIGASTWSAPSVERQQHMTAPADGSGQTSAHRNFDMLKPATCTAMSTLSLYIIVPVLFWVCKTCRPTGQPCHIQRNSYSPVLLHSALMTLLLLPAQPMGIVEQVGPEVKNVKVGDRVVVSFDLGCGRW